MSVVEAVRARVEPACRGWGLATPTDQLVADIVGALDRDGDATALRLEELALAKACARGDARALELFDTEYLAKVPAFLARHPARGAADEVRQRLRERLLVVRPDGPPRIADYSGRGSLGGWLRVATLRVASNLRRDERPAEPLRESRDGLVDSAPELRLMEQRFGAAFREALGAALAGMPPADRTILKLHYFDGLTVDQLAPILDTSRSTAGRRLAAARDRLEADTLALLGERIPATSEELRSVLRALVSRLEVSLRTVIEELESA